MIEELPIIGGLGSALGLWEDPDVRRERERQQSQAKADQENFMKFYQGFDWSGPTQAQVLQDYGYESALGRAGEDYLIELLQGSYDTPTYWGMPTEVQVLGAEQRRIGKARSDALQEYDETSDPITGWESGNAKAGWDYVEGESTPFWADPAGGLQRVGEDIWRGESVEDAVKGNTGYTSKKKGK